MPAAYRVKFIASFGKIRRPFAQNLRGRDWGHKVPWHLVRSNLWSLVWFEICIGEKGSTFRLKGSEGGRSRLRYWLNRENRIPIVIDTFLKNRFAPFIATRISHPSKSNPSLKVQINYTHSLVAKKYSEKQPRGVIWQPPPSPFLRKQLLHADLARHTYGTRCCFFFVHLPVAQLRESSRHLARKPRRVRLWTLPIGMLADELLPTRKNYWMKMFKKCIFWYCIVF